MKTVSRGVVLGALGSLLVCSCAYDWDLPVLPDPTPDAGAEAGPSFPDADLPDADGLGIEAGDDAEAGPADAEVDAADAADAGPEDASRSDGSDIIPDATVDAPPPEDAGPNCDKDKDGYAAMGACGGTDCDDDDPRKNPGVTTPQSHDGGASGGDWNCNGTVERLYNYNVTCASLALGECTNIQGFTSSPACGAAAAYVTCRPGGLLNLLCVEGTSEQRVQQCR